jgi:hypothetical protein
MKSIHLLVIWSLVPINDRILIHFLAVQLNTKFWPLHTPQNLFYSRYQQLRLWLRLFKSASRAQVCVTNSPSRKCQRIQSAADGEAGTKSVRNEWSGTAVCSLDSAAPEFQEPPWSRQNWSHTTHLAALLFKMQWREARLEIITIQHKNSLGPDKHPHL